MEQSKINIIAAMLARSNMGMPRPETYEIKRLKESRGTVSLDSAVTALCEQYMESDEHYDIFMGEGQMFVQSITDDPERSASVWADIFKLYDEA